MISSSSSNICFLCYFLLFVEIDVPALEFLGDERPLPAILSMQLNQKTIFFGLPLLLYQIFCQFIDIPVSFVVYLSLHCLPVLFESPDSLARRLAI